MSLSSSDRFREVVGIGQRRFALILVAIAAVAGLVLFSACGGDGWEGRFARETPTPTREAVTPTPGPVSAGVSRVDCVPLITREEVGSALGGVASGRTVRNGEVCKEVLADDDNFFVQIQPGEPGDFEPGALVIGVSGEPVTGVGDEARWFGGEEAEGGGDAGVIAVRQETSLGTLRFRIFLGRPDLDSAAQMEIAKTLALNALPRFPGVEVEQPEPVLVTFEPEPVDRSEVSYADNVLVKEEAGEWTLGEGLVATLRLFAGEVDESEVLRHSELIDYSGTGVVRLAKAYLETGPDEEARTEITRLLDLLVPSIERLEQEGAIASSEVSAASLFVSLDPVLQRQEPDAEEQWCNQVYNIDSPCVLQVDMPLIEAKWPGRYLLYRPVSEVAGGWKLKHIDWAREAIFDSATVFEPLGKMPKVVVIFTPQAVNLVAAGPAHCEVTLGQNAQQSDEGQFKQRLALTLAHCLIGGTFPGGPWWGDGLAVYLSGVVEDDVNLEHKFSPLLANEELSTTLLDRTFTNWVLFEYMHGSCDEKCIFDLILGGLPSSAGQFFHEFEKELTDAVVQDIGPGTVPYEPLAWRLEISSPLEISLVPPAWGVRRVHAVVDSGKYACYETFGSGEFTASWRQGKPGETGFWEDAPAILEGESVFLVTATGPGGKLDLTVTKVVDDPDKCEDPTPAPGGGPGEPDLCEIDICLPSDYYTKALGQ